MYLGIKKLVKKNRLFHVLFYPILKLRHEYFKRRNNSFADIFTNILEGSVVVNVNNIPGKYEIDARSHILQRVLITKEYEPVIVELIKKNIEPNKDAINIGANIGLFTNLMADNINQNCKCLAIEPTPNAYKLLKGNIARNGNYNKVIVYNGIATDKPGIYKINIIQGKEEYSSIGKIVMPFNEPQKYTSVDVEGDTVDNLVKKYNLRPGIIVIDVEGAEYSVLKGSMNTIKNFMPVIISEIVDEFLIEQNSNSKQLIELLEGFGYIIKNAENSKNKFPFTGNLIAIPKNILTI